MQMDEKVLVQKILADDRDAFMLLIKQYQRLVDHMISRLIDDPRDREEICQDIFIKVYQKIGEFKFDSKLSTWIATIAYRHGVNFLKKNRKWKNEDDLESVEFNYGYEDSSYEDTDYSDYIRRWILRLPVTYRTILTLYHLDGMTYPEIVQIMQMPEGTVKNYLFRARRKLKDLLEPVLGNEMLHHG